MIPVIRNKMRIEGAKLTIAWGLAIFFLCTFGQGVIAAESLISKRILIIYGNPLIGSWEQNFNQILLERLSTEAGIPLTPEHLSSLSTGGAAESSLIAESLRLKYSRSKVDLVIAVFPEANSFLFNWGHIFSPNSSKLYILPSNDVFNRIPRNDSSVVLKSSGDVSIANTLQSISQMLPGVQHIIAVGGSSDGDRSYLERIEQAINGTQLNMEISYLDGLTASELLAELESETGNSAILLGPYGSDNTGQIYRRADIASILRDETSIPVFSILSDYISFGSVGGYVSSSKLTAEQTVELSLSILSSEPISEDLGPRSAYMFDAIQLGRFGIDRDLLPGGSEVINDDPGLLQQYWWQLTLGGTVFAIQLLFITALGQSLRRRNKAERIAHDTNEQLRRAQKMEAVGQLTGGIAHDFNNILAIIMGNLELVKLGASGDKEILSDVDRALEGAARGTALIDKLLGFSRVRNSETSLTSVNRLIEKMDDLLVKSLTVSIEIETQLDPKLRSINVDAGDLEDAILNLALNARDAMPNGGRLIIETANKVLDADFVRSQPEARLGEYVMLSVRDTGIGMLPEVKEKALEPFFTTKAEGKGTGLGLSMVYGFVKRSSGFITLYSEPDAGTSINIFLPCGRKAERVKTTTLDEEQLPRGDETVLVVDDEEELAKLAVANLERLGYKVLTAFDGKSALALIKDNSNIDLLFSDVVMPGELDGYLLGIAAKKTHPTLKILLTSGFTKRKEDDSSPDNLMIEELTRNLLRKPYSQLELARAVRNALD